MTALLFLGSCVGVGLAGWLVSVWAATMLYGFPFVLGT